MYQAKLFADNNETSQFYVRESLERYGKHIKWDDVDRKISVLDVGCGDGNSLRNVVLPFCGERIKEVVGIDISSEMIKFATENTKQDYVQFREMDIEMREVPKDLMSRFDLIFSSNCMNWVWEQR